jgi:hypothetical protein
MEPRCLKIFATYFRAALVTTYETTHHNPEDHDACLHRHENIFFLSVGALDAFVSYIIWPCLLLHFLFCDTSLAMFAVLLYQLLLYHTAMIMSAVLLN